MATLSGSAIINSPGLPESVIRGRMKPMMIRVAVKTGTAISVADLHAASSGGTL
jgi:hypothetical protein